MKMTTFQRNISHLIASSLHEASSKDCHAINEVSGTPGKRDPTFCGTVPLLEIPIRLVRSRLYLYIHQKFRVMYYINHTPKKTSPFTQFPLSYNLIFSDHFHHPAHSHPVATAPRPCQPCQRLA